MILSENKSYFQFELLKKFKDLQHFSTTIHGGVSIGNYATLNLGLYSGDSIESVSENRNRLCSFFHIDEENLYTPYQTHEDKILIIDDNFIEQTDLEKSKLLHGIDAIITNQKGIGIAVGTADCVPILLYDSKLQLLAAIHAGWRGTALKIVSKTISIMKEKFGSNPANIIAGIAPSISREYFEVGDEVVEAFEKAGFSTEDIGYRCAESGKIHLDLWFANEFLLFKSGIPIENIETSGLCTYSNPELFFSARRQGISSGRMLTGGIIL